MTRVGARAAPEEPPQNVQPGTGEESAPPGVRIIIDRDEKEALKFLKKAIWDKIARSQRSKLKIDPYLAN